MPAVDDRILQSDRDAGGKSVAASQQIGSRSVDPHRQGPYSLHCLHENKYRSSATMQSAVLVGMLGVSSVAKRRNGI